MDSSKRNLNRYTSIIVLFVLLVSICFLVKDIYSSYIDLQNINKENSKLDLELLDQSHTITSLNEELNYYNDLKGQLLIAKQTYFDNAYKVDQLARNKDSNIRVCYLTFDDGPYLITDKFLDVLQEKDVLATFFTRKRIEDEYKSIYLREKINGHTIGNHTASHKISKGIYRSNETFIKDILENREFIFDMLGITTDVMRFPGGSYQTTYMGLDKNSLVNELNEIGYGYVDWTHVTGDGGAILSSYEYLHNVIDYTDDDKVIVVLMHDYSENTLKCLPELIDELRLQGYVFLPLWYDSPAVRKVS